MNKKVSLGLTSLAVLGPQQFLTESNVPVGKSLEGLLPVDEKTIEGVLKTLGDSQVQIFTVLHPVWPSTTAYQIYLSSSKYSRTGNHCDVNTPEEAVPILVDKINYWIRTTELGPNYNIWIASRRHSDEITFRVDFKEFGQSTPEHEKFLNKKSEKEREDSLRAYYKYNRYQGD